MSEMWNLYPSFTGAPVAADTLLMLDTTATPPSAGQVKQVTIPALLGVILQTGDTSGTKDTAAYNAAVAAVGSGLAGQVTFTAGNFYLTFGSISAVTNSGVKVKGAGIYSTTINAVGSGAGLRMYDTVSTRAVNGGGFADFTIDGSSTTGACDPVHVGDIQDLEMNIAVQNFTQTGAGAFGIHFDNQHSWTEHASGKIRLYSCAGGVVFDHATGAGAASTGSYDRAELVIWLDQSNNPTFDGVSWLNGANIQSGKVSVYGNMGGSASALTSAALRITGQSPVGTADAGTFSSLLNMELNTGIECDSTAANGPICLAFGSTSNFVQSCNGALNYTPASTAFQAATNVSGNFDYAGNINGAGGLSSTYTMTNLNTTFVTGFGVGDPAQMVPDAFGNWQNTAGDGNVYDLGQHLVQTTAQTAGTTGTSAQNVTGLVTPALEAGAKYYLDILLSWEPTVTGGVTNFGLAAGSSLTLSAISMGSLIGGMGTAAAGGTAGYVTSTTLSSSMWTSPTRTGTTGFGYCHLWGTVTVNHAGTLQVVFANGTSADTATIAAGATMLIRPAN